MVTPVFQTLAATNVDDGSVGIGAPAGVDGRSIVSIQIIAGNMVITLSDGTVIQPGSVMGPAGRGVSATNVNGSGHLVFTFTDGSSADLGQVTGRGIASVAKNGSNHLIVTFTDTTTTDVGSVIGPAGLSVSSATVNGSGHLILTMSDTSTIDAGSVVGPAGPGTGDFSGPSSSVDSDIVLFNGTTGKLGKDSGIKFGTGANNAVQLDSSGHLPALDGRNLTNVPASVASLPRVPRTSNTMIIAGDKGSYIDITSGTFNQTFDTPANLGVGFWMLHGNSGSGVVTLAPTSGTIDGLSSYPEYSHEVRFLFCDGSNITTRVLEGYQVDFLTSGTWTKSPGYLYHEADVLGGGGGGAGGALGASGSVNVSGGPGGGAGGHDAMRILASLLGATETVTVGAAGTHGTGSSTNDTNGTSGTSGGSSSFGSWISVTGGSGATATTVGSVGVGAKTLFGAGATVATGTGQPPTSPTAPTLGAAGGPGGATLVSGTQYAGADGAQALFSDGLKGTGGAAAATSASAGGNGTDATGERCSGGSGAAGGSTSGHGGKGGKGGLGAGGAGGGAANNGSIAGDGGDGGAGRVRVKGII